MTSLPLSRPHLWLPAMVFILALGATLRLIDLADPPLDSHPSRQLPSSLVALTYRLNGGENYASSRIWSTVFWLKEALQRYPIAAQGNGCVLYDLR